MRWDRARGERERTGEARVPRDVASSQRTGEALVQPAAESGPSSRRGSNRAMAQSSIAAELGQGTQSARGMALREDSETGARRASPS